VAALIGLCSCDLAPDYAPPQYVLPADYKGSGPFTIAQPRDTLPRGPWWEGFGDPLLNQLEQQLTTDNPDLAALAEQYTQARDLAAEARSLLFPQIGLNGLLSENKESKNRLFRSPNSTAPFVEASNIIQGTASWEPDFWGAIRNSTRAQKRLAQASAATLANARLSLQAELASSYIALRGLDAQQTIYRTSIDYYQKAVEITTRRLTGRIASGLDVARSQGQVASTEALQSGILASRAQLEHAIAVLVGANPSSFSIPVAEQSHLAAPAVPVALPSQLLERRPDIAAAERRAAAANAQIGVARAAWFPTLSLAASGGYASSGFSKLFEVPNRFWSLGPDLAGTLVDFGARHYQVRAAIASYDQSVATYRQTVLSAFQDVEDNLATLKVLAEESIAERAAADAAAETLVIVENQYKAGTVDYLNVVAAQNASLGAERAWRDITNRSLAASVALLKALGGGWRSDALPFN
jgi:multidrug efflux system outer membrane protein